MKKRAIILILAIAVILLVLIFNAYLTGMITYTSVDSCSDSDLGIIIDKKGMIRGDSYSADSLTPKHFEEEDYCKNEKTLVEYYCISQGANLKRGYKNLLCSDKCISGQCNTSSARELNHFPISAVILILFLIIILYSLFRNSIHKRRGKNQKKLK